MVLFDPATNAAIREALPPVAVEGLSVLTHLGDGATVVGLAAVLYWFGSEGDRADRALVLAIAVATLALVAGLKGVLQIPRPTAELAFAPADYGGYSTPSAHAMGAAAVYGGLAATMNAGTRRLRYPVAGCVIAVVALSRVVVGVHYLGDVLLGAILGLGLVALGVRLGPGRLEWLFAAALAITLAAYALGSREYTTLTIGAALGGLCCWPLIRERPAEPLGASVLLLGLACLPLLTAVRLAGGAIPTHPLLEVAGYALAFGAALAVPVAAARLDGLSVVRRLQTTLPFRGRVVDPAAAGEAPIDPSD